MHTMKECFKCIICVMSFLCVATAGMATVGDKFKVVTKLADISDGDQVIVVRLKGQKDTCNYVLSKTLGKTSIKAMPIDVNGDVATVNDDAEIFKIGKSGSNYNLFSIAKNKYLCNDNTKNTSGKFAYRTSTDKNFKTTSNIQISFGQNSIIKLFYPKSNSYINSELRFSNVSGAYFNCYTTEFWDKNENCVRLFKKVTEMVSFSDVLDNANAIAQNKGNVVNVALTRTLVGNKWNTFCVPFDMSLDNGTLCGVKAFVMEYAETMGNVLMFVQSNAIEAGKAYLIKPTEDIVNPVVYGATVVSKEPIVSGDESGYSYRGVYSPKTFDEAESERSLIVNGNDEDPFLRPAANSMMKGMRAYFTTPTIGKVDMLKLSINGEPTGISEIVSDADSSCCANGTYTIEGIKVDDASCLKRGVYIRNGKKYVAK